MIQLISNDKKIRFGKKEKEKTVNLEVKRNLRSLRRNIGVIDKSPLHTFTICLGRNVEA